jgi:hypothetical protein
MKLKHHIEKQIRAGGFAPWQLAKFKVWARGVPQRQQAALFRKLTKV